MNMQKSLVFVLCVVILATAVIAQNKLEVSTTKESFNAGEKITFKVSLYDSENNPINENVNVVIEDAEKRVNIEKTVLANKLVDIDLGENVPYGYWKIIASYGGLETTGLFYVEINEIARFELDKNTLTITNIGNTEYSKNVQIIIGETIGVKKVDLGVGGKLSFRLIAPDGVYNVKVSDGKTTLTKSDVQLTGEVIGILDSRITERSPVTGGVKPGEESIGFLKNTTFIYVFFVVIFGAVLLLIIERRMRKKVES